ncbi:MAG: hypothetical protein QMD14_00795 [Candidatus Aenigmarchaeota archaeon]|nr:hypothetical protein [Candidatus Aenigmarchaeota archaeon]
MEEVKEELYKTNTERQPISYEPKNNYLNKLKKYFKKVFRIIRTDYLPSNVLGMTDCEGNIWIRRLCDYLDVLKHEINHNLFPHSDEYKIREITQTGYPYNLREYELVYV